MDDRSQLTRRRGAIPAALAGLILLGAAGGAWTTARALHRERGHAPPAVASAEAAVVAARLQADAALLVTAGRSMAGVPRVSADLAALARSDPGASIGIGRPGASGAVLYTGTGGSRDALDLTAAPAWRVALEVARDGDQPVVAVGPGAPAGTDQTVMQALALYGPGAPPVDVTGRRQALLGYVVLMRPAASLLGALPGTGRNLAVELRSADGVLAASGSAPGRPAPPSSAASVVNVNGANWVVRAWSTGSPSRVPWVVLFAGLAVAAIGAAVVAGGEAESTRLARAATARSNELSLVARTGPLLQQSLELGDLLPRFVVEISDELDLDGVGISLVSDAGQLMRVFSLGVGEPAPVTDPSELSDPPASVPAAGVVTVPLQRGGRVVGALTARARSGLDGSQVETLRAVSDLLAAALGNARLLEDEQAMVVQLRDLDRLKTTFLGSVSHDLRTTVTAIEGFATLLATHGETFAEEQRTDFLQRIERNARSLGVLVEDLLDFARLERAGVSVTLQPVDLSELVPNVVDQMYSILGDRPLAVSVAPAVVARADPGAMERILINLLSNAAKYTPAGSAVTVSLERDGADAALCVSDRGAGIPPAERLRIFERFYRIDNEDANQVRGVGIGLALVRQLVDLQRGTVAVDDAPGGGARFRVTVPLDVVPAHREEELHVPAP
ncbi:MAG: hypothetical protein NVS1B12_13670 [Acidimicrobiales bacterium]